MGVLVMWCSSAKLGLICRAKVLLDNPVAGHHYRDISEMTTDSGLFSCLGL